MRIFPKKLFMQALLFVLCGGAVLAPAAAVTQPILLAQAAAERKDEYAELKASYEAGKIEYANLRQLVTLASKKEEKDFARKVAGDYINHYLLKLPEQVLFTKDNLEFIGRFISSPRDPAFKVFYPDMQRVNAVVMGEMRKAVEEARKSGGSMISSPALNEPAGYAGQVVAYLVGQDEVAPALAEAEKKGKDAPWSKLERNIARKYDPATARRVVLDNRLYWYYKTSRWNQACAAYIEKGEQYGYKVHDGMGAANAITDLFVLHCDDRKMLKKVAEWERALIEASDPQWQIGDYGNLGALLYKLGEREEGIRLFEQKIQWPVNEYLKKDDKKGLEELMRNEEYRKQLSYLERMKRGEKIDATWDASVFF
jgi:hypothetical protein